MTYATEGLSWMMSMLSSNKPPKCCLKLGASIRQHAHGCRLYGYRVSYDTYEIIDGYEQSYV